MLVCVRVFVRACVRTIVDGQKNIRRCATAGSAESSLRTANLALPLCAAVWHYYWICFHLIGDERDCEGISS